MPGVLAWGYYPTDKIWLPVQVDANGRLKADMSAINLDDLADVEVPTPTDGYILYWDAATSLWKCKAIPAAAWAAITGKPTAPSLEELATEHDASGLHAGMVLDNIGDVSVAAPTDGYIIYWDAATSLWKCKAIPAAAWAAITGKPTSPSLEELATEHDAAGLHTGEIVLADTDIPAGIARDAEVIVALLDHTALPSAHHTRYTDAEAKAAAVLAGAITDTETKAPTHDAVYDVKVTADGAIPKSLLTERGSVIFRNASAPAELLHGTVGQVLQSGGHGADPSWASAPGGTKIQDADGDTSWDTEQSADQDKIHGKVKGVEAFLLDDAGILTLAKQSGASAYLGANQSIPSATWTIVTLNTELFDIQGEFDSTTNYRFTAKVAGIYLFCSMVAISIINDGQFVIVNVRKNGTGLHTMRNYSPAAAQLIYALVNGVVQLAVGDYLDLLAYQSNTTTQTISGGSAYTYLDVVKIA